MILSIYSIFDKKALTYAQPVYAVNHACAERMFRVTVNQPGSYLNSNPEDYQLVCLGAFDDSTGEIVPQPVQVICEASALVESFKNAN